MNFNDITIGNCRDINIESCRFDINGDCCTIGNIENPNFRLEVNLNDNVIQNICQSIFQGNIDSQKKIFTFLTTNTKPLPADFKNLFPNEKKIFFLVSRILFMTMDKRIINFIEEKASELHISSKSYNTYNKILAWIVDKEFCLSKNEKIDLNNGQNVIDKICKPLFDNENYSKKKKEEFINSIYSKSIHFTLQESFPKDIANHIFVTHLLVDKSDAIRKYIMEQEILLKFIPIKTFIQPQRQIPAIPSKEEKFSIDRELEIKIWNEDNGCCFFYENETKVKFVKFSDPNKVKEICKPIFDGNYSIDEQKQFLEVVNSSKITLEICNAIPKEIVNYVKVTHYLKNKNDSEVLKFLENKRNSLYNFSEELNHSHFPPKKRKRTNVADFETNSH